MPPLAKGSSQKTVGENIREMLRSETFAEGKPRKKKVQMAQAAAIAHSKAGYSRTKRRHRKRRRSLTKDAIRSDHG